MSISRIQQFNMFSYFLSYHHLAFEKPKIPSRRNFILNNNLFWKIIYMNSDNVHEFTWILLRCKLKGEKN